LRQVRRRRQAKDPVDEMPPSHERCLFPLQWPGCRTPADRPTMEPLVPFSRPRSRPCR
jgi:hypothetical protein